MQTLKAIERLYTGYKFGEMDGQRMAEEGNAYLEADFPLLSYIVSAAEIAPTKVPPPSELQVLATFKPKGCDSGPKTRVRCSRGPWRKCG